jgi:hypothetical protein
MMKALFLLPDTDQTEAGAESSRLLVSGAPWRGVLLDLYGSASDEHGYEVDDVALKGSTVSLVEWFNHDDLLAISAWCDEFLPTGAELRALERSESGVPWLDRPPQSRH